MNHGKIPWLVKFAVALGMLFANSTRLIAQEQMRNWTDNTGSFQTTASLLAVESDRIQLETSGGKLIWVDIKRLSEVDQEYLVSRNKPAESKKNIPKAKPAKSGMVPSDLTDFRTIVVPSGLPVWKTCQTMARNPVTKMVLKGSMGELYWDFFGPVISFTPDERLMVFSAASKSMSPYYGTAIDTVEATILGTGISESGPPSCLTPDATYAVAGTTRFFSGDQWITIASNRQNKFEKQLEFFPFPGTRLGQAECFVTFVDFINNDLLLTYGENGMVRVWDYRNAKLIWQLQCELNCIPFLAPNRSIFLCQVGEQLVALRPSDGEILGALAAPKREFTSIGMNHTGDRVSVMNPNVMRFWDLGTAELLLDVSVYSPDKRDVHHWIDDRNVVIRTKKDGLKTCVVIDSQNGKTILAFTGMRAKSRFGGRLKGESPFLDKFDDCYTIDYSGRLFYAEPIEPSEQNAPVEEFELHSYQLLPEDLNTDDYLSSRVLLQPGEAARMDFDLQMNTEAENAEIRRVMTNKLVQNGVRIDPAAKCRFRVFAIPGNKFVGNPNGEKLPVVGVKGQNFFVVLFFDSNGDFAWQAVSNIADIPKLPPHWQIEYFKAIVVPRVIVSHIPQAYGGRSFQQKYR